jgi:hypothetical protein
MNQEGTIFASMDFLIIVETLCCEDIKATSFLYIFCWPQSKEGNMHSPCSQRTPTKMEID